MVYFWAAVKYKTLPLFYFQHNSRSWRWADISVYATCYLARTRGPQVAHI